jgi:hypothetical protein
MTIVITRTRASLQYLHDPKVAPSWANNNANNSLDSLQLIDGGNVIFTCLLQTVVNLQGLDDDAWYYDTIAPGPFQLKLFVEQRAFWPNIHGVCSATTLRGDTIGPDSVTAWNQGRWLMHDWEFPRGFLLNGEPVPQGRDTSFAQSAGCLVTADAQLVSFNDLVTAHGLHPGDVIDGELRMEA